MNFSSFIAQRLTFQSKRTFSKLIVRIAIVGIMLGLGVMILSIAIVKGFKREIQDKVRGFAGDIQITKFDNNFSYENSPFMIDTGFVRKVQANTLVKEIMPYATKPGIIKANGEIEGVVLKGVDKSFTGFNFARTLNLSMGVGYQITKHNRLVIEPFFKYPLGGLGSEQIRFGSGGINLQFKFQGAKK